MKHLLLILSVLAAFAVKAYSYDCKQLLDIVMLYENNKYENAITGLNELINDEPSAELYFLRGNSKFYLEDYSDAIEDFTLAISMEPKNKYYFMARAKVKKQIYNFKGFISDYDQVIQLDPSSPDDYFQRGTAKSMIEDYKGAIGDLDKCIELDTAYPNPYFERAKANVALGEYALALPDLAKCIELAPSYSGYYDLRGNVYLFLNRNEEALNDFIKALSIEKKGATYYGKAQAEMNLGYYEDAVADLIIELLYNDHNEANIYNSLVWCSLLLKKYNDAIGFARQGLEIAPDNLFILMNQAHAFLLTDQLEKAKAIYMAHLGETINGMTWQKGVLQDFDDFARKGITHPDMDVIRKLFEEKK